MNTNPNAIKILCYGDSNTWGQKPDKTGRYVADARWTGLLQQKLGDSYHIIEEGLGGRTTDLDYTKKPGRNGRQYFVPCLVSHTPIDIVVIMLGTNDLKIEYRRTAEDIATAIEKMLGDVAEFAQNKKGQTPKIVLVSPIEIYANASRFSEFYTDIYNDIAMQESKKLADTISAVATRHDCLFVDAASVAHPGEDGIHMSADSQEPLAEALYETIKGVHV